MNNQDILFGALMGSNKVQTLERMNIIQNDLYNKVLPPIPFLPIQNQTTVQGVAGSQNSTIWKSQNISVGKQDLPLSEEQQFFPLSFSFDKDSQLWRFPYEPMVSISGGNNIVKRNVAKHGTETNGMPMTGTIKERFSQKDFEITITGVLFGELLTGKPEDCFPRTLMTTLLNYLTKSGSLNVYCEPLNILGILKIVIEDFSFPFTKGENVQAYEIKASSDMNYNLLMEIEIPIQ